MSALTSGSVAANGVASGTLASSSSPPFGMSVRAPHATMIERQANAKALRSTRASYSALLGSRP